MQADEDKDKPVDPSRQGQLDMTYVKIAKLTAEKALMEAQTDKVRTAEKALMEAQTDKVRRDMWLVPTVAAFTALAAIAGMLIERWL